MLVALGYSCQTRFLIDELTPGLKRQPFDFNITSRPALINALATDGASLENTDDNMSRFVMPSVGREGIEVSGMFFWHDYPMDEEKLHLQPNWRDNVVNVNSKYAMLWARFSELLRSDQPKQFVMTNSQHNLPDFAADDTDFKRKFGLGKQAFHEIVEALDAYGAQNYKLRFISRLIEDYEETLDLKDDRLEHSFVGKLRLRVPLDLAHSLFPDIPVRSVEEGAEEARSAADKEDIET